MVSNFYTQVTLTLEMSEYINTAYRCSQILILKKSLKYILMIYTPY